MSEHVLSSSTLDPQVSMNLKEFLSYNSIFPSEIIDVENVEINPTRNQIWKNIKSETKAEKLKQQIMESEVLNQEETPRHPEIDFLEENIFPILLPVLTNTILAAQSLNCLKYEKSIFNGIDFISQLLYNLNPRFPERKTLNENIYLMEWTQQILEKRTRPIFPKSFIWSREEAALVIQSYMRGHFVRRLEEVQEMRQFWKTLQREKLEKEAKEEEWIKQMKYQN